MSQMANAKFEQFRDTKLGVFYNVQKTWYDLYKIRKDISISEKNIEILQVIQRLALVRYKSASTGETGASVPPSSMPSTLQNKGGVSPGMQGMQGSTAGSVNAMQNQPSPGMKSGNMGGGPSGSGLSDLYRIEIEKGDLQNNISQLRNQENTLLALFNSFLNRKPASPVFTSDTIITDTLRISPTSINDSIKANNPMLSMIRHEQNSYEARKKMVKGMGYPMIGAGIDYSVILRTEMASDPAMNGKDMIMPMVSVTVPVYRKKYKSMKKEAELLGQATSENYEATNNQLETEYYQATQMYQDAGRKVKLYNEQYQLASQTFDLMHKGFSAGTSDLTDVLRIRQQMLDYDLNRTEAAADINTSVAWLKRLMASSTI
jgi:outer membrane protein TolC